MTTYNAAGIDYNAHISYGGQASLVSGTELPNFILRVTDKDGNTSLLPKAIIDNMSFESSSPGGIKMSVHESTIGYSLVKEYSRIDLLMNGQPVRDGSWLLRESEWNEGVQLKTKSWTGITYMWDRLANAIVWNVRPSLKYNDKSLGFILDDVFDKTQARGGMEDLTWTFTAFVDSFGNSWPGILAGLTEFKTGLQISDIVNIFVESGQLEIWQVGNEIKAKVGNSSPTASPALLVVGKDITEAPQKASAVNVAGHIMAIGDDDIAVLSEDATVDAKFGYRDEKAITAGGTSGSPHVAGAAALLGGNDVRVMRTYNVVMNPDRKWFPIRDYNIEQNVRVEHGGSLVNVRVKQITLQVASGGIMSSGIVLNDKLLELDVRLAKMLKGIQTGQVIVGSSRPPGKDLPDTTVPAKVAGLALSSGVYQTSAGVTKAYCDAAWTAVTLNTDSSPIDDLANYYLAWWYADRPFATHVEVLLSSSTTQYSWENLDPNRTLNVYVYTKDSNGHQGSWSDIETIVLSDDTIAPNQPSTPTTRALLKQLVVSWDGKDIAGTPLAPDARGVQVYTQLNVDFDPDPTNTTDGTLQGIMTGKGDLQIPGFNILDKVYVRLVGLDLSGNRSVPSASVSQVVSGISGVDINANTILANNIGAGQINAIHVKAGAITTDKITLGQTENLVQDPGFADAGWRARRLTTEFTEHPTYWFFKIGSAIQRSGYLLQMLSINAGENQGKMMITDWINVQMGEIYFAAAGVRIGEGSPNVDARFHLGFDVTYRDGNVNSDYLEYDPDLLWTKVQFQLPMQPDWGKIRFWIRPFNLSAGDIAIDDLEVRSAVGTTALSGPRGQLTPQGLNAYDVFDTKTVEIDFATGNAFLRGELRSGEAAKRLLINPGVTYLPELRFYPTTGVQYAYINAVDNGAGTIPYLGLNAPDTGVTGQCVIISDTGITLGELNKTTFVMAGAGLETYGSGASAGITLYGKLTTNSGVLGTAYMNTYNAGINVTGLTVSKAGIPTSGQFVPFYSLHRVTGTVFSHHINQNLAAQWATVFNANASVTTIVHELMIRGN